MKNILCIITLFMMMITPIKAQNIFKIENTPNQIVEVKGNLSEGQQMTDLSWAWNSAVACFPQTQVKKFTGNHVLYVIDIPRYSEVEATVIPDDKSANFSIYAYEVGQVNESNIVPKLSSCIRCEADHKWDYKYKGKTQDHTRTVKNLLAINNPYQAVIGIVGAEGLSVGGFTLLVNTKSR